MLYILYIYCTVYTLFMMLYTLYTYNIYTLHFIYILYFIYTLHFVFTVGLKKGLDIYKPLLTGKPEQQWSTVQSGILTSINSQQSSIISGHPFPEWMDFGPTVCTLQLCYAPISHPMASITYVTV